MALDVQPITGTPAKVAARLCNFATGKSALLPAHAAWLDSDVRPLVASNPVAWVDVIGHASRQWRHTGGADSHDLNRQLSWSRCKAVEGRITTYRAGTRFNVELALGDSDAGGAKPDDGYDRAVEVFVYGSGAPPKKHTTPTVSSTKFEIRVVGGGSGSLGIQADDYFFQIVDLVRSQTAFFFYTGVGLGISIPKIPGPGSATKTGPPTAFRTTRSAELYQFNSRASLYQDPGATFGSASAGGTMRLSIREITDRLGLISTIPGIIAIEGGAGIQMPGLGSASEGVLAYMGKTYPFSGY